MRTNDEKLMPGDIFFTRGSGWISRAIRRLTKSFGEPRTVANHVGLIAGAGFGLNAWGIEALSRVRLHKLYDRYADGNSEICIFRPRRLTAGQKEKAVRRAGEFVNRKYGYLKIVLHFLDWFLLGAYVFRRIGRMDRYPICSYVVASAFKAIGKDFAVSSYAATPDDIWDFCINHPDRYRMIWQSGGMYRKTRRKADEK